MTSSSTGATVRDGGVEFRVWAPDVDDLSVIFDSPAMSALSLGKDDTGYFTGFAVGCPVGAIYRYCVNGHHRYPDPYSRYQPDGPHGSSQVVDPNSFQWSDAGWSGLDPSRQIVYEMHIGTFTPEGTYQSAGAQLEALRDLGITSVEILPVAEFVGAFGWGYDGVNWFAPFHHYGAPDDLRRFVDKAHALGIGVILDVVYNHFGFDGNYLSHFARGYFTKGNENPWGATINYDLEPVRRMAIDNASYWIREYHFDGLRLDATQNIHDPRHPTLLATLVSEARRAAGKRSLVISGEDYLQRTPLLDAVADGGAGFDQLWNDDFHHSSRVNMTGSHSGYFSSYRGTAQELLSSQRHGYLFQGQYDNSLRAGRGAPVSTQPLHCFVAFTQNHDQVANTLYGRRIHTLASPGKCRAMTALLLLGTQTPMLFMGQEFNASAPFAYFADYQGDVASNLWTSRKKELAGFDQYLHPAALATLLNPCALDTVRRCTLDFRERETHAETYQLYRDLITLRRSDAVLARRPQAAVDGAVLSEEAFVLRFSSAEDGDRLLVLNLGAQIDRRAFAEPLLAPAVGTRWVLAWSSDEPLYGGVGALDPVQSDGWRFPAESAMFLMVQPEERT